MNFLSFRDQIYDWTLDTDENLFSQVNQLTDYIFQTQQNINQSIAITRSALNDSSTILNNNFNHYLRLSENKFTENKIAEPKKIADQTTKTEQVVVQLKSKMDIFKEALNISLKNLQIKEEEKQADNVSISQLSLSQAIFKNARLPPYFGSKEFRAQKFLNLFFDEDLGSQIMSKRQIQSLSNKPLSTPSQDISNTTFGSSTTNVNSGYLPPPPSLQTLGLSSNNNFMPSSGAILPPPPIPPPLNLLSPPTLSSGIVPPSLPGLPPPLTIPTLPPNRQSVIIDQKDENKQLLESILASTKTINNNADTPQNNGHSYERYSEQPTLPEPPQPVENKPLTFQQELALKLKYGKDYKPPVRVIQSSKPEPIAEPKRQPQATFERTNSFRQSTKIQDIIGGPVKPTPKQSNNAMFADDDQEEQNALFGSGKRKTVSQTETQNSKFGVTKNEADLMMSRSTFNQDMLFKKKPVFTKETILPAKTEQKPKEEKKPNRASMLFNQDSDEQQDNFTFKKKTTKKPEEKKPEEQSPKKKPEQKKSNPLGFGQKSQVKEKPVQEPKKKNINKLFGGDSDEEGDIFAKKKPMSKKQSDTVSKTTQSSIKIAQKPVQKIAEKPSNPLVQPKAAKKNSLFNDDEEQQDFAFKPKPKPVKKQSKNQQKKSSLFGDDDQDDSAFKPKSKTVKKQSEKQTKVQEVIKPKVESPQKSKGPLFGSIPEQQNEEGSVIIVSKKIAEPEPKQIEKTQQHVQSIEQESQEVKRMKKIARMGGQPMMGMAQMIPKGMHITKPSETKQNQKIARQHLLQTAKKREDITHQFQAVKVEQVKVQIQVVQQPIIEPKRELDPLQKLVTETLKHKQIVQEQIKSVVQIKQEPKQQPQAIQKQQPKSAYKQEPKSSEPPKKQEQIPIQMSSIPEVTLQVRRKKNKPKRTEDDFFDDDQAQSKQTKVAPIVKEVKQEKAETPKQTKKNPLMFTSPQKNEQKSSQIQKIAKMSMAGMPQMGLGPMMMPKGLVITKPSQAKKLQQQALEKQRHDDQQRDQRHKQQQKQKQRLRQLQEQQQQSRKAQQEERSRLKLQEQALQRQQNEERQRKQRIAKQAKQKQQRLLHEKNQRERIAYEDDAKRQQEIQRQRQQEIQRQRQQEIQRQRQQEIQRQRQQEIQRQRQYELEQQQKRIEEQSQRQRAIEAENQRLRQKQIEDLERLRKAQEEEQRKQKSTLPSIVPTLNPTTKKQSPLGNPLGGKPKQTGPLDVPKMPPKVNPLGGVSKSPLGGPLGGSLGGSQKSGLLATTSGSGLSMPVINKEAPKNTGKKSLFDDDEDDGFSKKKEVNLPKTSFSNANQKKKPSLFGDDDEESGFGFGSKAKPKKNTTSKKGLFDDDDDEGFGFGKKTKKPQVKQSIIQAPIIETQQQSKPLAQKANLLNNDSDDDDGMFGKKKALSKQPIKPTLATQRIQQEVKIPQQTIAQKTKAKKGLFGGSDSDEDSGFGKKKVEKKPVQNLTSTTNKLVQDQPKPVSIPQKQIKSKKGLFGSSDQDDSPIKSSKPAANKQTKPVVSKQTKPKKGLFGGSDDEDDDPFKKKAQKKPEPVKPTNNIMQSEPLIPTKKAQSVSPSPLSASKIGNPLGGLSSGPLQSKTSPLSQPTIQAPKPAATQQKKRNIFQESDEQSSPIIASKSKIIHQQPQKKGLISQESQEQKPQKREQKAITVVPVRQQEPQISPPVQTNNNRRLFDDSEQDSDQEEMARKRRMANNKLKKLF